MGSYSYLSDKLPYYRLPFLSKSAALKLLNFGERRQRPYPGAKEASSSPILLLPSSSSSSYALKRKLIQLPVYPVNKRDEEKEERKSSRGSRLC